MNEVVVALIAFAGTLLGSLFGVIASAKLTNYRLAQLETKVDKHNNFAERIPVLEQKLAELERRIVELSKFHQPK